MLCSDGNDTYLQFTLLFSLKVEADGVFTVMAVFTVMTVMAVFMFSVRTVMAVFPVFTVMGVFPVNTMMETLPSLLQ